jgi:hypothetical protein
VIVGEWGFFSQKPEQVHWAERFVKWLKQYNIHNSFFWVSVSNSGDTGGLWIDGTTFDEVKYNILQDLWNETVSPNHRTLTFRNHSHPTFLVSSGSDDQVVLKYSPIVLPNDCHHYLRG